MDKSDEFQKNKPAALPIETSFRLPSPLPTWPSGITNIGSGFARGCINFAGLELCQVSTFIKVWATHEGGEQGLGATFFRPQLPAGYSILGHYCQSNSKPLYGWVLAGKANDCEDDILSPLKKPIGYTLVYSSQSSNIKQDGVGYIWLPKPPEGYSAVGYFVTNSPEMPSAEDMRCVRSDLTESCSKDLLIWEANNGSKIEIYRTKPANIGVQAPGISVGTFMIITNDAQPSDLACLKNKDYNLAAMPNLQQIETIMQAYSPYIYFHSDEVYLPSSVSWFFSNGALLYKQGDPEPIPIDSKGSNLPQGGDNDGTYWIDLPANETKEVVKKGSIENSVCYLHIKPMLGATFTDIAIWVFYPFNGPARAKVEFVNVSLGRIGEHVGDWEHMTLRVSNFTGELWSVFFSEHGRGTWVESPELEFYDKNKGVAYASLHGHAFYSKAGLVLQGNSKLGVGIRNDTDKGKGLDSGQRYEVVGADYLDSFVEPAWINYKREWGPKITYDIGKEIEKGIRFLPGKIKSALKNLIAKLPVEVLGEEGPTGPKMKSSWIGDESSSA